MGESVLGVGAFSGSNGEEAAVPPSGAAASRQKPDFRSREFLLGHIRHTLSFYDPRAVDPNGGFYHCFMNDGTVFDAELRTLVASCRFVFNYAKAYRQFGDPGYLSRVGHGIDFLRRAHRHPQSGGYAWRLRGGRVEDGTNHCYGLAFVLLAYACALDAGVDAAGDWIGETFELMERRFWLPEHGLYASESDAGWKLSPYRGQNDNMHACEAMIAAYEATHETRYLDRACLIAESIAHRAVAGADGYILEHYRTDWTVDHEYARGDQSNPMRPWGVQTGHQTEWAKLLFELEQHRPQAWRLPRARQLFDRSVEHGWDAEHGGLIHAFALDGAACDRDKYFWVQAESIAAAAVLGAWTGEEKYWAWYDWIWDYAYRSFVDHEYGAWYRILTPDNRRYDERKSYNNKADYHTMGACHEALRVIR
ncbi:MAG: AGE family epimerase/isomerase [Candidatus Accumulibacter sp.]|jgi:mannose/cellobiose epimerase-like protein (N-acyl-D-glucosamine 2-epimerase family)|nr:AGE family epimerase/isomerase [Accumulibacter sp.]